MRRPQPVSRHARSWCALGLAVVAAGTIAGCGASAGGSVLGGSGSANPHSPFVVGTTEPLSGTYEAAGQDIVHALRAEASIINARGGILGHRVEVDAVDTASDPQKAISASQQLLLDHSVNLFVPDVIYGETELPLAKNLLTMNLCAAPGCGGGAPKTPLNFTMNPPASAEVPSVLAYARTHRLTRVGVLVTNDAQGTAFAAAVKAGAGAAGVTVSSVQTFSPTTTDVTEQVQAIKGSGARAVLAWAAGDTVTTAMKAMLSDGYKVPVLGTPTVFTGPVNELVPKPAQGQLTCLCYSVGVRSGAQPPATLRPFVDRLRRYGPITSMMVTGIAADLLSMADYGYTKAGSFDARKAAAAIQAAGSDPHFPRTRFWAYRSGAPHYTATDHSPAPGPLARGFYGVAEVSPLVDGMYHGTTPFDYSVR